MTALVEMENSGLVPLLVGDGYEDLARMYALFRRADGGLDLLRSVMGAHLKKEGSQLVQVRVLPVLETLPDPCPMTFTHDPLSHP